MGSVDKAAIVWTIAIVLIGASVAIVGSNFDQADSKQGLVLKICTLADEAHRFLEFHIIEMC